MAVLFYQLITVAFLGALLALPVLALRDIARRPAPVWHRAGRSRRAWTAAVVLLPVLGAAAYYAFVRGRLRAAELDRGRQ